MKTKIFSIAFTFAFLATAFVQPISAATMYSHSFEFEAIDESDLNSMQSALWWGISLYQSAMTGVTPTDSILSVDANGTVISCENASGMISCQFSWEDENPIAPTDVLEFPQILIEDETDVFSPQAILIQMFFIYVQTMNPYLPYVEVLNSNDLNVFTYNTTTADVTFSNWTDGSVAVKIEKLP